MNRPDRLVVMIHDAWPTPPAATSPKGTNKVSGIVVPPTTVPSSLKSTGRACLLSMILGWADSILKFFAVP